MSDLYDFEIFKNNKTSLKETSKDNHDGTDIFMTESTLSVVNFDAVKNDYIKGLQVTETPASNDALYLDDFGEYYFIEFKNGVIDKAKIFAIRLKIFDSLLIFTDIIGRGVSYTRNNLSYILVYNEGKNLPDNVEGDIQVSPSREAIAKILLNVKQRKCIYALICKDLKNCISRMFILLLKKILSPNSYQNFLHNYIFKESH